MTKKRQIILAIVGVSIMIVLLVGSSYAALFNYENVSLPDVRTNSKIVFSLDGDKEVLINNKIPISSDSLDNNENVTLMNINIKGYNNFQEGCNYRIFMVKGDDDVNLLDDSVVFAQITYNTIAPGYTVNDYGVNENRSFGKEGAPLTGLNEGKELKIVEGNIHTLAEDAKQDFTIKVWLDSSKVIVSDTINRDANNRAIDCEETDLGKLVYRTEEFENLSMSIKLKVENN